jgi:hypothetical protein
MYVQIGSEIGVQFLQIFPIVGQDRSQEQHDLQEFQHIMHIISGPA